MLDVSFFELVVIGIVALVVIGPERLPKVARTAGHLFGRMQRYVNDVKADISREMQLDELKKLKSDFQESARNFEQTVSREMHSVEDAVHGKTPSAGESDEVTAGALASADPELVISSDVSDDAATPASAISAISAASATAEDGTKRP